MSSGLKSFDFNNLVRWQTEFPSLNQEDGCRRELGSSEVASKKDLPPFLPAQKDWPDKYDLINGPIGSFRAYLFHISLMDSQRWHFLHLPLARKWEVSMFSRFPALKKKKNQNNRQPGGGKQPCWLREDGVNRHLKRFSEIQRKS